MSHPFAKSIGVFILTLVMLATKIALSEDLDVTNEQMPFTRGWYTSFFIFAVLIGIGCWMTVR